MGEQKAAVETQVTILTSKLNDLQSLRENERNTAAGAKAAMQTRIEQQDNVIKELQTDDAKKQLKNTLARLDDVKAEVNEKLKMAEQAGDEAEAQRRWLALAYSPELNSKAMNDHIVQFPNLRQRKLLQGWLDEFESPPAYTDAEGKLIRDRWWIMLQEGKASADAPKQWRIRWHVRIKVGSDPWQVLKENHDWEEPTQHHYPDGTWVAVPWSPGQPIRVQLIEVGRTYNTTRIDRVFDGPVAMWQMHNNRWLYCQDGDDWVGIKLSVWKCPGPSQR